MRVAEELRKDADLAIKEGGMYYSGEYLDAIARRAESEQAENARLRELTKEMFYSLLNVSGGRRTMTAGEAQNLMDRMRELRVEVG